MIDLEAIEAEVESSKGRHHQFVRAVYFYDLVGEIKRLRAQLSDSRDMSDPFPNLPQSTAEHPV